MDLSSWGKGEYRSSCYRPLDTVATSHRGSRSGGLLGFVVPTPASSSIAHVVVAGWPHRNAPLLGPHCGQNQPVNRLGRRCLWNTLEQDGQVAFQRPAGMTQSEHDLLGFAPTSTAFACQTLSWPCSTPTR